MPGRTLHGCSHPKPIAETPGSAAAWALWTLSREPFPEHPPAPEAGYVPCILDELINGVGSAGLAESGQAGWVLLNEGYMTLPSTVETPHHQHPLG